MPDFKIIKTITIPGQLISKKNNLMGVRMGKFVRITHKRPWKFYEIDALDFLKSVEPIPLHHFDDGPIYMHIWHYRRTKGSFDYSNLCQGVEDVLQGNIKDKERRHAIIPDDSNKFIIPVHESPIAGWSVDKLNPRTVVTFTADPWYITVDDVTQQGLIRLLELA